MFNTKGGGGSTVFLIMLKNAAESVLCCIPKEVGMSETLNIVFWPRRPFIWCTFNAPPFHPPGTIFQIFFSRSCVVPPLLCRPNMFRLQIANTFSFYKYFPPFPSSNQGDFNCGPSYHPAFIKNYFL